MIVLGILLCATWHCAVTLTGLPLELLPDLAAVLSAWAGLRATRGRGVGTALVLGATSGLFTVEPWATRPLVCGVCALLASRLTASLAPRRDVERLCIVAAALVVSALVELLWRVSTPSSILHAQVVPGLFVRALVGAPIVLLVDGLLRGTRIPDGL